MFIFVILLGSSAAVIPFITSSGHSTLTINVPVPSEGSGLIRGSEEVEFTPVIEFPPPQPARITNKAIMIKLRYLLIFLSTSLRIITESC
ncbi:MAG: hypothetical protein BWY64_01153 [bacterium ADurb.Bin363]|nr:MAG: hypothetical protein BWY64_01153 [bacterium ADurb.Bin363]